MKNEEILKKAIEKAHDNGYRPLMSVGQIIAHNEQFINTTAIVFTHDFAKAFWGAAKTEYDPNRDDVDVVSEGWKYHLQQMVLEEDPIKYLERFLES